MEVPNINVTGIVMNMKYNNKILNGLLIIKVLFNFLIFSILNLIENKTFKIPTIRNKSKKEKLSPFDKEYNGNLWAASDKPSIKKFAGWFNKMKKKANQK